MARDRKAEAVREFLALRDFEGNIFETNNARRRFFRCWLDGSYLGEEHYRRNLAAYREAFELGEKACLTRLASFAMDEFGNYIAHELESDFAGIKPGVGGATISKAIRLFFGDKLEAFKRCLIHDLESALGDCV